MIAADLIFPLEGVAGAFALALILDLEAAGAGAEIGTDFLAPALPLPLAADVVGAALAGCFRGSDFPARTGRLADVTAGAGAAAAPVGSDGRERFGGLVSVVVPTAEAARGIEVLDEDEATDVRRGDAWVGAERDPAAVEAERLRVRWSVEWRGWRVNDYRVSFAFTKARKEELTLVASSQIITHSRLLPASSRASNTCCPPAARSNLSCREPLLV